VIKGNQSIIVDTTADDESSSRKEAPNGDFDMIPKCMQRNPPPGSTEVLDKIRMISDFKEMLLPDQRRLAGWLAGWLSTGDDEHGRSRRTTKGETKKKKKKKQGLEEREEMDDLTSRRRKGGGNVE
jgi:hypothetical protein